MNITEECDHLKGMLERLCDRVDKAHMNHYWINPDDKLCRWWTDILRARQIKNEAEEKAKRKARLRASGIQKLSIEEIEALEIPNIQYNAK